MAYLKLLKWPFFAFRIQYMVLILYTLCSFLSCLGDPAKLHIQIRDFDVDMQSLEELSLQELRALCEKSDIPVSPVMNIFIFINV